MSLLRMVPKKAWYVLAGILAGVIAVFTLFYPAIAPFVLTAIVLAVISYLISICIVIVKRVNEISKLPQPWKPYFVYSWHKEKAIIFRPSTSDFAALIKTDPIEKDVIDSETFLRLYQKNKKAMTPELWNIMSIKWYPGSFAIIVGKADLPDDLFMKFATHRSIDIRNAVRNNPHAPEEAVIASALTS